MDRLEVATARVVRTTRQERDKEAGVMDRKFADSANSEDTTLAELAVAKFLNVYPDLSSHPRKGGPDAGFNGVRFDVKHSPKALEDVEWSIAGHKTKQDADMFIFTWGKIPPEPQPVIMFVVGWLPFEEACCEATKTQNRIKIDKPKAPFYYRVTTNLLRPPIVADIKAWNGGKS